MGEERQLLAAVVDPEVAFYWAVGRLDRDVERMAAGRSERLRRKMFRTRDQIREAGRQWGQARLPSSGPTEVVEQVESMTVAEAAVVLGVSAERVRRLAREEVIEGRQVGRAWVLEAWSVEAYRADRERRASA